MSLIGVLKKDNILAMLKKTKSGFELETKQFDNLITTDTIPSCSFKYISPTVIPNLNIQMSSDLILLTADGEKNDYVKMIEVDDYELFVTSGEGLFLHFQKKDDNRGLAMYDRNNLTQYASEIMQITPCSRSEPLTTSNFNEVFNEKGEEELLEDLEKITAELEITE
ncbi:MAG: hypothetical protein CMM93_06870 [Rickettsiales bacterium]|nr:hypothetical protein [Rickettsiales bacterium]|tara:strand:+ start:317 stop:817 length:501 start_codon:yes stop_codon:yes gene_type:complete